jgi:hypothetical protein
MMEELSGWLRVRNVLSMSTQPCLNGLGKTFALVCAEYSAEPCLLVLAYDPQRGHHGDEFSGWNLPQRSGAPLAQNDFGLAWQAKGLDDLAGLPSGFSAFRIPWKTAVLDALFNIRRICLPTRCPPAEHT